MRDWEDLVRDRLGQLRIGDDREVGIVRELAGYLEDHAEVLRQDGWDSAAAEAKVVDEDWAGLRRGVCAALRGEDDMTARIRRYFIPALLMHVLAVAALVAVQRAGLEPRVVLVDGVASGGIMFYVPWLVFLPVVGALRGLLARTRGEDARTALVGASFPAVIVGGLLLVAMMGGVVEHALKGGLGLWYLKVVGTMLLSWLVIPGAAMIAGAVPFVVASRQKPATAS